MPTWCLIKSEADKFRKALKDGTIEPNKLMSMTSAERRAFFEKFISPENSKNVNALFESKLLLKNQKAGMITWAKKVANITPNTRRDMIAKIERLQNVLDPKEGEQFLQDLVNTKLGLEVSQEEAKVISDLSTKISETRALANKDGVFPSEEKRLEYGASKVAMENYINDLKLRSRAISFKEQPVKKITNSITQIPGIAKSLVASLDNSFWGRQGIKTLLDVKTTKIWTKNFLKSWSDIARQATAKGSLFKSGDDAVMDGIKADIYSRPNALNGKYSAGGYGLDVLSEEAYPSSLPEKIPLLGRLFKASEVAYNGGALRLRADLADKLIKTAEKQGINTLVRDEARPLGNLVGSMTGRGSLGKAEIIAKPANEVFFSIKFLKSNLNTLASIPRYGAGKLGLVPFKNKGEEFAAKEASKNFLRIISALAAILSIAKVLNPDSVEEDPRSNNFGKIKMFGHWVDITGGMAGIVRLAAQLVPTKHEGEWGFWYKNSKGEYTKMEGEYGQQTPLTIFDNFWHGKLSPVAGILRDVWARKMYNGEPVTVKEELKNITTPISIQNINQLKTPESSLPLGSLILDGLGFSVSTSIQPNIKTKVIPENERITNSNLIKTVLLYSEAFGTDPETTFNRLFSGQRVTRVTNGAVIVERMPLKDSQAIKTKLGGNNPQMKLDHTIPLQLGGSNDESNLKLVTTAEWKSYTPVENALGKALKEKKISKKEAQDLIIKFKEGRISKDSIMKMLE